MSHIIGFPVTAKGRVSPREMVVFAKELLSKLN